MAEPSRKKNKGRHTPNLVTISVESSTPGTTAFSRSNDENSLCFSTQHPTEPCEVDLTEFATGLTKEDIRIGKQTWVSDFIGRPELIADLLPIIKQEWMLAANSSIKTYFNVLRAWWRTLDEAEKNNAARVTGVEVLHELHYSISRKMKLNANTHSHFLRLVNLRRKQKNLPTLYWPSPDKKRSNSDVPAEWEMNKIRHELKHGWFAALLRWKAGDKHQPDMLSWKGESRDTWHTHDHAVYRAIIENTGHPFPSQKVVAKALGYKNRTGWLNIREPISGLYPISDDIRYAFHLCLLYAGWNSATLIDLDVTKRFVESHPTNPDYHVIYGFKKRGRSEHFCIGRNKRSDAPGSILRTLVERTKPLREWVIKELTEVDQMLKEDTVSGSHKTELIKSRLLLQERSKSPWLYVDPEGGIVHLTNQNCSIKKGSGSFIRHVIQTLNLHEPPDRQVRESITAGDFRDAYISFAYEFSGYSILTAQRAAMHKSATTTQIYLGHKAWKAHSAKKVNGFGTAMWNEIEIHGTVDPTILRARMEHGDVTEEERKRLADYRIKTRIGVGCKDPKNPPPEVAPNHQQGSSCRIHRCTLCPQNAILFDDSYDGIAMRLAELENFRDNISVTVWVNSSFNEELDTAENLLKRFDPALVQERLVHWREAIKSGLHTPIGWEGAYK